MALIILL